MGRKRVAIFALHDCGLDTFVPIVINFGRI